MAPPGFAPPSYATDNIPERLVHKDPPPPGVDTNGRAYLVFFSYLGLCVFLTNFIIFRLLKSYQQLQRSATTRLPPRNHVRAFVILAAGSLVTTWYYQYKAFNVSYRTWMMWRSYYDLTPDQMHWGLWLKETSLYKETWMTTIVGNARYWWTHQIFFLACVLSLTLEQKGARRGIKHTWAFMLLGQVIGISFATNLFLLHLLVSPPPPKPPTSTGIYRRKWLGPWVIQLVTILFVQYPAYMLADEYYWFHQTDFLPMLLTPHIALLVLPFARAILPAKYLTDSNVEFAGTVYRYLWGTTIIGGALLFARITSMAYGYSGAIGIWNQLFEHPAVSSVAFDVIFCWLSWYTWWRAQPRYVDEVLGGDEDEQSGEWVSGASGTLASGTGGEGGIRRR
ncbi:hypothetical protein K458DRAFT_436004 [Lentithecium fluviatile CBS 122367]|uniref:Uncharacterized protein n=1 Tax=Lentithecium fluviatile CBS 122367 TaxID=1168545 RepID=A0A6G1IJB7_9PLEO|nr:hypothetical protein K458DRAFT_436004 [Lentithecium fluviatile CBS 122367]